MKLLVIETKTGLEAGFNHNSWLLGLNWGDEKMKCFYIHLGPVHLGWAKWNTTRAVA
jgi:hypothetical protein